MLDLFVKYKKAKIYAIIIIIVFFGLFVLFPIFSVFFEDTVTSNAITSYGYQDIHNEEGGNNYLSIETGTEEEEELRDYLEQTGLWHSSIQASQEAQILWYKTLSGYLEKTYLQGTKSTSSRTGLQYKKTSYVTNLACKREFDGDYANDECDLNGNVDNTHSVDVAGPAIACGGGSYHNIATKSELYYKSADTIKQIGGKILGLYPDVIVNAAMANTYNTLDQNKLDLIAGMTDEEYEEYNSLLASVAMGGSASYYLSLGFFSDILKKVAAWYEMLEGNASAIESLKDTFAEGSLYSTFDFSMDSSCTATDVIGYYSIGKMPDNYKCQTTDSVYTKCVSVDTGEVDEEGNPIYIDVPSDLKTTDGDPDTYYYSKSGGKYCDYVGSSTDAYGLKVHWICNPTKYIEGITCTPEAIKDDQGNELYYYCSDVSSSLVRTAIVDKVFDAYENNTLKYNNYMTYESVNKYVYGSDESKYKDQINPNNYKIDDETRNAVTKHIVMEIIGGTEGRTGVICDKNGHFSLQSYNRVLNKDQYEDSLKNTIFVKDNIVRKEAGSGPINKDKLYSEKLYGVFYSEYNSSFDDWSTEKIEQQKKIDESTKKSLILEIFSTYDYVKYYLQEYGSSSTNSGSGLALADSNGYRIRTNSPTSKAEPYSIGLFGECAWYATGRIREILSTAGSSYDWTTNVNGGNFCYTNQAHDFIISNDYTKPRVGSVVSWTGGIRDSSTPNGYGHVAIIEKVYDEDNDGNIDFVDISEGGVGFNHDYARTDIWNGIVSRQQACGTGKCFNYRTKVPVSFLKNYSNSSSSSKYKFACYIYLLRDESNPNTGNKSDWDIDYEIEKSESSFLNKIWLYDQKYYDDFAFSGNKGDSNYCSIKDCGCGVASAAILVSSFKNMEISPVTIQAQVCTSALCTASGTADNYEWALQVGAIYDLNVKPTTSIDEVIAALRTNKALVSVALKQGDIIPTGGHWVVLTGIDKDGKITLADSWYNGEGGYKNNNAISYKMSQIASSNSSGYYYIYTCDSCF